MTGPEMAPERGLSRRNLPRASPGAGEAHLGGPDEVRQRYPQAREWHVRSGPLRGRQDRT